MYITVTVPTRSLGSTRCTRKSKTSTQPLVHCPNLNPPL